VEFFAFQRLTSQANIPEFSYSLFFFLSDAIKNVYGKKLKRTKKRLNDGEKTRK